MNRKIAVFVDSDAAISSLLSQKGAAYLLINSSKIRSIISNYSEKEIKKVAKRMNIKKKKVIDLLQKCKIITIDLSKVQIEKKYRKYVYDKNDTHIIAGADTSKTRFLITYNVKDYKIEHIKRDFNVIVLTPGMVLQYLRSRR